jgi:hypothetical protein
MRYSLTKEDFIRYEKISNYISKRLNYCLAKRDFKNHSKWLKLGDENHKLFFKMIQESNRLYMKRI